LEAKYSKGILGVEGKNIVKLVPLSKKTCLFIGKELTNEPVTTYLKMRSKKEIRLLNTYIVDNSNELLIAGRREQLEKLVKMRIKS